MTVSTVTENTAPPKSTKYQTNSSVQIQIQSKSQFEFVPRVIEESEFLDLMDYAVVTISVKTVIHQYKHTNTCIWMFMRKIE